MENQGVRKLTVHDTATSLKLWIFTPDLTVSTSARASVEPIRVAKILWKDCVESADIDDRLNGTTLSEGELMLWQDDLVLLREKLKQGGDLLPEGARRFQDWNVGLLERFTREDLGLT